MSVKNYETTAKMIDAGNNGVSWYEINGVDYGTGYEYNNDTIGVTACNAILDCDGCPMTEGDRSTIAVRNILGL